MPEAFKKEKKNFLKLVFYQLGPKEIENIPIFKDTLSAWKVCVDNIFKCAWLSVSYEVPDLSGPPCTWNQRLLYFLQVSQILIMRIFVLPLHVPSSDKNLTLLRTVSKSP